MLGVNPADQIEQGRLAAPLGPMMPTISRPATVNETSSTHGCHRTGTTTRGRRVPPDVVRNRVDTSDGNELTVGDRGGLTKRRVRQETERNRSGRAAARHRTAEAMRPRSMKYARSAP